MTSARGGHAPWGVFLAIDRRSQSGCQITTMQQLGPSIIRQFLIQIISDEMPTSVGSHRCERRSDSTCHSESISRWILNDML